MANVALADTLARWADKNDLKASWSPLWWSATSHRRMWRPQPHPAGYGVQPVIRWSKIFRTRAFDERRQHRHVWPKRQLVFYAPLVDEGVLLTSASARISEATGGPVSSCSTHML